MVQALRRSLGTEGNATKKREKVRHEGKKKNHRNEMEKWSGQYFSCAGSKLLRGKEDRRKEVDPGR